MKRIYIVHGWTYSLDKWQQVCELLIRQGIEPVQLKVPGLSEKSDEIWDIDGYVEWLHSQLVNEQTPVVLGHSNGGRIALAYCQKYPDHFQKLILVDAAGIPHDNWRPRAKIKILRILSKVGKPLARVPLIKKVFYKLIGAKDYNTAPPNMKLTMQNMLNTDNDLDLSKVTMPTTLIWGREDKSTPIADGQKMQELIANSSLHIIDGAGHSPHTSHPEKVTEIIVSALK